MLLVESGSRLKKGDELNMIIKVKIHPNSSKKEIKKIDEDSYEVWLKERAEDNKANIALAKLLRRYFNSEVRIRSGFRSKNKVVEVKKLFLSI